MTRADAILFTGGSNNLTLTPGYSIIGNVIGAGSDTFQLGGASGSAAFDLGLIGPSGQYQGFSTFNVVGATWTVTGSYGQTDPWNVQGGTIIVNGDLSPATSLTVNGGTLMGTGIVGATQINAGGTFAPGSGTPGTSTTVSGNLAFQPGALYAVHLNPSSATFATVSGTATLAGTVNAQFAAGSYLTKQYTILSATGGTRRHHILRPDQRQLAGKLHRQPRLQRQRRFPEFDCLAGAERRRRSSIRTSRTLPPP